MTKSTAKHLNYFHSENVKIHFKYGDTANNFLIYPHLYILFNTFLCLYIVHRACRTSTPVTFRSTVASSPPTVWSTTAWWSRSPTLVATPFWGQAEVGLCVVIPELHQSLTLSETQLLFPFRPVDRPRASS